MKKTLIIIGLLLATAIFLKIGWEYVIPSQDIQRSIKNLKADKAGLNRTIVHCVNNNDCVTWEGVTKIYPFPDSAGTDGKNNASGAAFSFTMNGKKIICGPGWRIVEK